MSMHVDHMPASHVFADLVMEDKVEYAIEPEHEPCLVLSTPDSAVILNGTESELLDLAARIYNAVTQGVKEES